MTQAGRERLLGGVHAAVAIAGMAVGLFLILGLAGSREPNAEAALAFVLWLFVIAQAFWLLPALIGGLGLVWGQRWARGVIGCVSAILLFAFPVGTMLGAAGLWVLYGKAAKAQVRAAPKSLGRLQGLALCAIAAMGLLGLMIGLGYLFRDFLENAPPPPDRRLVALVICVVVAIGVVIYQVLNTRLGGIPLSPGDLLLRVQGKARQAQVVAEHKARLARLAADPMRAKYVAMIEAGDYWTDAQIAYDLDPDRTQTCEHLAPIERAMRQAGVVLKPTHSPLHVDARCLVDAARIAAMEPPPSVRYVGDHFILERFGDQIPAPLVNCALCNSALHTEAPETARPGTPSFP